MLKQLFSALRGSDTLDEAFRRFVEMLEHAEWMFKQANAVCLAEEKDTKKYGAIKTKMDESGNVSAAYRLSGPPDCTVPHFPATI